MIGAGQTASRVNIPGVLGAMVVEGVARVQPAKLVRGLAQVVEAMGVTIHARKPRSPPSPPAASPPSAARSPPTPSCAAPRASPPPCRGSSVNGCRSTPRRSPRTPAGRGLGEIGWKGHEILGDFANAYCYCQRTREGRITVGARGVPYRFGSAIDNSGAPDAETIRRLTAILHRHFPATPFRIDHAWCGVIGVPRDWCATAGLDPVTRIGWAGGYVGVGVSTSNLSGRTLAT
jgi:glycine/D-amino acid oxidase-like deaminating enzyme